LSAHKLTGITLFALTLLLAGCRTREVPTPPLSFTPAPPQAGETQPEMGGQEPVALVNGQPITLEQLSRELARFEAGQAALGFEVSDEAGYRQQVLDMLVENELIRQYAAGQGITISDEEVDAEIGLMIGEYGEEYFNSWLQSNYYSLDEFREELRLSLISQRLMPAVVDAVPTTAEHVHARHILVNTQADAESILAQLQGGADFAELAGRFSTDVTTRDRGGDLGWFPRGGLLVPEVEEVAFSQQAGQLSGVVPSAWGYHIVQTLEYDPAREVDPVIRDRLRQQAAEQWKEGLRSGADIQQFISPPS
jgi:parvulin-like peptidyl-prolyl isomerase